MPGHRLRELLARSQAAIIASAIDRDGADSFWLFIVALPPRGPAMDHTQKTTRVTRRTFVAGAAAGIAAPLILPRHVIAGGGQAPPSEVFGGALIGCGGQGPSTFRGLGPDVTMLAQCDVKFKDRADNKTFYTDFRYLLERADIDVVAIATPPGWHALISIAAMEATGSIAATSTLPSPFSCTTTLQGSIVPTLSSAFSAS